MSDSTGKPNSEQAVCKREGCTKSVPHVFRSFQLCLDHVRQLGQILVDKAREEEIQRGSLEYDDLSGFPHCTDTGNGIRFAKMWYEDVLYVPEAKAWYTWNGKVWEEDSANINMLRMAKLTALHIYTEAANVKDDEARKKVVNWARASESQSSLEAMIRSAKSTCQIFHYNQFDQNPWLFNAANCTIDLRAGTSRGFQRKDYMTKASPVKADEKAGCPRWKKFLSEILPGHEQCCIPFLQRAIGYSLTGRINEECFFVCWGPRGRNGKSKFIETIRYILGDYAKAASFDTFVAKKGDEKLNDIAGFRGARMVVASESEYSKRLAEAKIKRMTGDDPVVGEFKYQEQFSYVPTYKIWLVTNPKPKVVGTDDAIWDRMHLIPFLRYFGTEERDLDLGDKLKAEASGILTWAIQGCLEWQRQRLKVPKCISDAGQQYRKEQNVLGQFVEERCVVGADKWVGKFPLFQAYKGWADLMGEFCMPMAEFTERMKLMFQDGKSGPRGRHWKGVALKTEWEEMPRDQQEDVIKAVQ
jgi:putative DNA primase/helicase